MVQCVEEDTVKIIMKLKLKGRGGGNWNRSTGPRTNCVLNENMLWHFVKIC